MVIPINPGWVELLRMFDNNEFEEVSSILSYSPEVFRNQFVQWLRENRSNWGGCFTCVGWGSTTTRAQSDCMYIGCPDCGRGTHANLGVNCPAGMAVAFGHSKAIEYLRSVEIMDQLREPPPIRSIMEALKSGRDKRLRKQGKSVPNYSGWWSHTIGK